MSMPSRCFDTSIELVSHIVGRVQHASPAAPVASDSIRQSPVALCHNLFLARRRRIASSLACIISDGDDAAEAADARLSCDELPPLMRR
jgi:hypothetical protein